MSKQNPKYTPAELLAPFRATSEPSQATYDKWDKMMTELAKDVDASKELSHLENQFFAFGANNNSNFKSYNNSNACKDEAFEVDIFIYSDKVFNGSYQQPKNGKIVTLSKDEVNNLHLRLDNYASEWKLVVDSKRHKDQLLQRVAVESTQELAKLRKIHRNGKISVKHYLDAQKEVYWRSRMVYLKMGKVLEEFPLVNYQPVINGTAIAFTEYTLVHILNRHFMGVFQFAYADKTMMPRAVDYSKMHVFLFEVISKIEQSGLFNGQDIGKIPFQFKGDNYIIWTATEHHSSKDKKNHTIQRLNSFHKVDVAGEVTKLNSDYKLMKIDNELSVYISK